MSGWPPNPPAAQTILTDGMQGCPTSLCLVGHSKNYISFLSIVREMAHPVTYYIFRSQLEELIIDIDASLLLGTPHPGFSDEFADLLPWNLYASSALYWREQFTQFLEDSGAGTFVLE